MISPYILVVIAILLIILFVWLLIRENRSVPRPTMTPVAKPAPEPARAPAPVETAARVAEASPPVIDDLEIIEGIGPKIADVLKQAGVTTFAQLAAMEPAQITEILHAADLRLADTTSWPEQARLAAAGDQAGLQALQDKLKGGRSA